MTARAATRSVTRSGGVPRLGALVPGVRPDAARWGRRLAWAGAAAIAAALALPAGQDLDLAGTGRLMRYVGILTSLSVGLATPHVLFPDPQFGSWLLVNPAPDRLLRHHVRRWLPITALWTVPLVTLALTVPAGGALRLAFAVEAVLAGVALGLYALLRYLQLGRRMAAWQVGEAGDGYRRIQQVNPAVRFLVPDGLVPGVLLTGEVGAVGAAVFILGQALGHTAWSWVPAGLVLLFTLWRLRALRPVTDRHAYATHGAWSDAFQTEDVVARPPLDVDAVYWAPQRWRPAVWAGLVSLDRRLPLGRLVMAGAVLVLGVELIGVPESVRAAALAALVLGINGAIGLTAQPALLPPDLARRLHSAPAWVIIRFLMNLRWVPPVAVLVAVLAWLSETMTITDATLWVLIDLGVAALAAALATLLSRPRTD